MTLTKQQALALCKQSKVCREDGYGRCVAVFSNGDGVVSLTSNDVIARGNGKGGWDYRVGLIRTPMTQKQVVDFCIEL